MMNDLTKVSGYNWIDRIITADHPEDVVKKASVFIYFDLYKLK